MATILTELQWTEILQNKEVTREIDLKIFQIVYSFKEHKAYSSQIGLLLGYKGSRPAGTVNLRIGEYAKKIAAFYEIDFTERSNQEYKFWDLFFNGWQEGKYFVWQLKSELIAALIETDLTGEGKYSEGIIVEKLPIEYVPRAYYISKKVYRKEITVKEGNKLIIGDTKLNPNSVNDYIYNFRYLLDGQKFTRHLNTYSMNYFLENIFLDYGIAGLSNALIALKEHIKYHKEEHQKNLKSMIGLVEKFSLKIDVKEDIVEQVELIETLIKEEPNRGDLINELANIKPTDPEEITINSKTFKRNNRVVAILKYLRNFTCQICSTKILKADGSYYIEAAHIKPKRNKGPETADNILILCPNHHKEFDYGKREVLSHTKDQIDFILNGKQYTISLKILE